MKLDIIFNRSEDDNGYATFRVGAYNQQPRRNMFLQDISIEEWSKGSDGNLLHYMKADKPVGKSVWRHSASLTAFDSYDVCKKDLIETMNKQILQFVKI